MNPNLPSPSASRRPQVAASCLAEEGGHVKPLSIEMTVMIATEIVIEIKNHASPAAFKGNIEITDDPALLLSSEFYYCGSNSSSASPAPIGLVAVAAAARHLVGAD